MRNESIASGLTSNMEDYLEAIFQIIARKEAVRPKDIAKQLNVSNASVTGALRSLCEKAMINYVPHDVITLTPAGKVKATDLVRRHEVLRDFFINILGVNKKDAEDTACKMEHFTSSAILDRFVKFTKFFDQHPHFLSEWMLIAEKMRK